MKRMVQYPFDPKELMRKRIAIRRELLAAPGLVEKRIAVLGGSTTHDIAGMLELFLLGYGIKPEFYESDYARYWEDAVFGNGTFDAFDPDIVFVHTTNRNILEWPEPGMAAKDVDSLFERTAEHFEVMWAKLAEKFKCTVIQNNFEHLPYRLLGNLDAADIHGRTNFINRLNARFAEWARSHSGFFINDINWQAADFGLAKWYDPACWHLYKYALSLDAIPYLAFNVANIIKAVFGKNKKAIAVDLDNTLWGGIIGDDGPENLEIGGDTAKGEAHLEFQKYLKCLRKQGVLLGVISKNDEEVAKAGLANPAMVLKEDDFVSIKANWEPKSRNLVEMAEELSLLPESFVFVDDRPSEREIVERQVPGCGVPDIGTVENFIHAIDRCGYFEATGLSGDDLNRTEMYRENAARSRHKSMFADYGEYLDSLRMHASIKPFEPACAARIAQLANKTSQFNLTGRRYTQEEIDAVAEDGRFVARYGSLRDRFGDNGIVAAAIGEVKGDVCELALWVMSCRVLKRDMELAMMDEMASAAAGCGCGTIRGFYRPTGKNGTARDLYAALGFRKVSEDEAGNAVWELDISGGYAKKNRHIGIDR